MTPSESPSCPARPACGGRAGVVPVSPREIRQAKSVERAVHPDESCGVRGAYDALVLDWWLIAQMLVEAPFLSCPTPPPDLRQAMRWRGNAMELVFRRRRENL